MKKLIGSVQINHSMHLKGCESLLVFLCFLVVIFQHIMFRLFLAQNGPLVVDYAHMHYAQLWHLLP